MLKNSLEKCQTTSWINSKPGFKPLSWSGWKKQIPGYHDEPLKGNRAGQRSIRLNKAYRAIYAIKVDHRIECVCIEEVAKHEY